MQTKALIILFVSFCFTKCFGQDEIEWHSGYELSLNDFKSPATRLDAAILIIQSGTRVHFAYQMSNYEFMFRKNFNDKIFCSFTKTAATLIATDSLAADRLIKLAQYDFDLGELYARKIRKRIFEEKSAFSSAQFFMPIFNELDKERALTYNNTVNNTNFGQDEDALKTLHDTVLQEIDALSEFCKECKPKK